MSDSLRRQIRGGFWVTSLGTLASRILGLVRDIATAALLGAGGVMDAFVVALRVPNLFRGLFGEGALAASYLPVLCQQLQRDRTAAWRLTSVLLTWLTVLLAGLVVIGEAICGLVWLLVGDAGVSPVVSLSAILLPYLLLICLAAQLSATLQALGRFSLPAMAPMALNLCWLAGVWWVAPWLASDREAQARLLAWCVLASGVLQVGVQLPLLARLGFRFDYQWSASRDAFWTIAKSMAPIALGLAATQVNTLVDSLIAWGLSSDAADGKAIGWLGGVEYPMRTGAAASIYYAQRFYQLPVGMLGLAIATVIFPALARHAARGDRTQVGSDLTLGLRLVWFLALPASVGLILLADPLARLCFERGEFSAQDAGRTARMIACYAGGVWAYCAAPVLVRGYYALGDRKTPLKTAMTCMGLNLALNLTLVWPLAEAGLAMATATSAAVQVVMLAAIFSRRHSRLVWRELWPSVARTAIATLAMACAAGGALAWLPSDAGRLPLLIQVTLSLAAGIGAFMAAAWLMGAEELLLLVRSPARELITPEQPQSKPSTAAI